MRLNLSLGPPTDELLSAARFLNPFLGEAGPTPGAVERFRETDGALITGPEKDLLVLLYYCHEKNMQDSPDEVVRHMSSVAEKYGLIKDLDTRKEPFTETEVCLDLIPFPFPSSHFPLGGSLSPVETHRVQRVYF